MIDFHVFRLRTRYPSQRPLLQAEGSPSELIRRAVLHRPTRKGRKNTIWHVGNVQELREGLYFALGRTTKSRVEKFDEAAGNFTEESFETAPYTHALVETSLQICAIASKPKVAPSPRSMAHRLAELMDEAMKGEGLDVGFTVDPLKDPEDFIGYIRRAYAVRRFTMTFRTPNPWDVERDFQAPLQKMLQEANGEEGKIAVEGAGVDAAVAVKLARAAASTGDDAAAVLVMEKDGPRVRRAMRKEFVSILADEEQFEDPAEKTGVLARLRDVYRKIRDSGDREGS